MDPLEQLAHLFAEAQDEASPPRIAPPDLLRTWRRICGDSNWQQVMFGSNSEEMIFDELDRAVGVEVGTMRTAWKLARSNESRGQRQ